MKKSKQQSAHPESNVYQIHPDSSEWTYLTVHTEFQSQNSITLSRYVPTSYCDWLKLLTWRVSMFKPELVAKVPTGSEIEKFLIQAGQKCTVAIELAHFLAILTYHEYGTVKYVLLTDEGETLDPRENIVPYIEKDGKQVTLLGRR